MKLHECNITEIDTPIYYADTLKDGTIIREFYTKSPVAKFSCRWTSVDPIVFDDSPELKTALITELQAELIERKRTEWIMITYIAIFNVFTIGYLLLIWQRDIKNGTPLKYPLMFSAALCMTCISLALALMNLGT